MPLFWLSLAFISGMLLASLLPLSTYIWVGLAGLCLVALLAGHLFSRRSMGLRRWSFALPSLPAEFAPRLPVLILAAAIFAGAGRWQSVQPVLEPGTLAYYNDREGPVTVEGVLVKPPDVRDTYTNLVVEVDRLQIDDNQSFIPVQGRLQALILPGERWHYGDRLALSGRLETPTETELFSYRAYLARQDILSVLSRAETSLLLEGQGNPLLAGIYALKERALGLIYRIFPDPEASLLAGILLGEEKGIPAPVQAAFKDTGTSHIIAISGFNMTIIAGLFAGSFGRLLGPRKGALAAVLGISVYTILVGANAAVVRAAIMGGLSIFARQVGRRQHGLNTLAFTAAVMALFNPQVLWDVGFQLSVAATLGLVLYAEPLSQAFKRAASRYIPQETAERLARPVGEYLLFTLAAQLLTLPVLAYHFRSISLVALIANPMILPAQPPVMILSGIAVILGLVYQPLGQLAGYLALPFVTYTIRVVELFAQIPQGVFYLGEVALPVIGLFFVVLFGWTFANSYWRKAASAIGAGAALVLVGLLAVLVWRSALSAPDGRLHLTLLEVSQAERSGDAIFIQTPEGRNILIDGGPYVTLLSDALGRRLPLGARQLDWLVVAGVEEAQLGALPRVLERFPPEQVLWAGPTQGTRYARNLQEALLSASIPVTLAEAGHVLDLGQGARLEVLTAGKRGAILLVEWGNFRALLPVGAGFEDLEALRNGRAVGPVSALMLADSGYAPANPPEWIANLNPQVMLLSVSAKDGQGRPSPEMIETIQGYTLLRTDRDGWIELSTDGEQMWVEVEKLLDR
jgi:competence protein ComEC